MDKDFFPIMPWGTIQGAAELKSVAECNFTIAGFVSPSDLPIVEKLGLKAIIAAPVDSEPWKKKWLGVDDATIDSEVKKLVETAGTSKAIMGYFLNDEPGTPKFAGLAKGVAAVRKYAPGKMAYINLYPGYATIGAPDQSQLGAASFVEYLERFVTEVKPDILSYDDYQVMYSDNFQSAERAAIYFRDLLQTREVALKHGIPFWNTVCSNRIRPFTVSPSPANLMLQAYTTLAAGGRGIAWYTYTNRGYGYAPLDKMGRRTETWYYLRDVNRQVKTLGPIMNKLRSTGVYFTSPALDDDFPLLPGKLVERVDSRASIKGLSTDTPPLMIGEFEGDDGGDYVMAVNLSLEKATNIIIHTTKEYASKEAISAVDGIGTPMDEENGHWLVPGQGVLIRLRR